MRSVSVQLMNNYICKFLVFLLKINLHIDNRHRRFLLFVILFYIYINVGTQLK